MRLGAIMHLSVLDANRYLQFTREKISVERAFDIAVTINDSTKTSLIDKTNADIDRFEKVIEAGEAIVADEALFLANDFSMLPFLVKGKTERVKCARFAVERAGGQVGKDRAKDWLTAKERELKFRFAADELEVA
jgi:hypothetical protein